MQKRGHFLNIDASPEMGEIEYILKKLIKSILKNLIAFKLKAQ